MARLVADKHTEAVVRQANRRRLKVWQGELRRRVQEGTAMRTRRDLCSLHPDAPEGLPEYFERREAEAWERRSEARQRRRADLRVNYSDGRFAA